MDPNIKLLLDEFVKLQIDIDSRFTEFEQRRDERVDALESATATFESWKPEVEHSISSVKLEVAKLNKLFDCNAKEQPGVGDGILGNIGSASASPTSAPPADGPVGHPVEQYHRESGYGVMFTHNPLPVKGMSYPTPSKHDPSLVDCSPRFSGEFHSGLHKFGGKLPKMNFPMFDGENPKLWISRCENYFEMFGVDGPVDEPMAHQITMAPRIISNNITLHKCKDSSILGENNLENSSTIMFAEFCIAMKFGKEVGKVIASDIMLCKSIFSGANSQRMQEKKPRPIILIGSMLVELYSDCG